MPWSGLRESLTKCLPHWSAPGQLRPFLERLVYRRPWRFEVLA
jgi:hypothetical protein